MGKEFLCNIQSINKSKFGTTQGTLLSAIPASRMLCFTGTISCDKTIFLKTKNGKTCNFQMTIEGTQYFVSEQNNNICLKEGKDSSCIFKVWSSPGPGVLIQAKASGRYLTTDYRGRITTKPIKKSSPPIEAAYQIEEAQEVTNNNYLSSSNSNLIFETSI